MKKLILIFSAVCILAFSISCNKDDDPQDETTQNETAQDEIIGTWTRQSLSTTEDGETTDEVLSDCEKKSFISFSADGTFNAKSYLYSDTCSFNDTAIGTWENFGDGIYLIQLSDIKDDIDDEDDEDDIDDTFIIEMSSSENTFMLINENGDFKSVSVFQRQ